MKYINGNVKYINGIVKYINGREIHKWSCIAKLCGGVKNLNDHHEGGKALPGVVASALAQQAARYASELACSGLAKCLDK